MPLNRGNEARVYGQKSSHCISKCLWETRIDPKNQDKVRGYQKAYKVRELARRAKMSAYKRAQEDLPKLLKTLRRKDDRRRLLNWAIEQLEG